MLVVIDADCIVWRAGKANGGDLEWPIVRTIIDNTYKSIASRLDIPLESMKYISYLGSVDKSNFRYTLATSLPYKANRKKSDLPKYFDEIREYIVNHYNGTVVHNIEADDAVGILHYDNYKRDPYSSIIVAIDKDLTMIPGLKYNLNTEEFSFVTEVEAKRFFYKQMCVGDLQTDNIPGLYKVGASHKDLRKLDSLTKEEDMFNLVKQLYIEYYPGTCQRHGWPIGDVMEYMKEQANLVRIKLTPDDIWEMPNAQT